MFYYLLFFSKFHFEYKRFIEYAQFFNQIKTIVLRIHHYKYYKDKSSSKEVIAY